MFHSQVETSKSEHVRYLDGDEGNQSSLEDAKKAEIPDEERMWPKYMPPKAVAET